MIFPELVKENRRRDSVQRILKLYPERSAQKFILPADLADIIKPRHFHIRHPEPLHHIVRREARLRIQDEIKIRLTHFQIFVK